MSGVHVKLRAVYHLDTCWLFVCVEDFSENFRRSDQDLSACGSTPYFRKCISINVDIPRKNNC